MSNEIGGGHQNADGAKGNWIHGSYEGIVELKKVCEKSSIIFYLHCLHYKGMLV